MSDSEPKSGARPEQTGAKIPFFGKPFRWTRRALQALTLVADDFENDRKIAALCGIAMSTLEQWKKHPEFKARVGELVRKMGARLEELAIAKKHRRVAALNRRWEKLHEVIEERAKDPATLRVAGGKTGLLVLTEKVIGTGAKAARVKEVAVDTGLLSQLLTHEKQAARELGQWAAKTEVGGVGGAPVRLSFIDVRAADTPAASKAGG
jgi:hypothetical protein